MRYRILSIGAVFSISLGSAFGLSSIPTASASAVTAPSHVNQVSASPLTVSRNHAASPAPLNSVFVPNETTGPWEVYNYGAGKVLDGNLPTADQNGSRVQLWDWKNTSIQKWYVKNATEIINENDNKCLDGNLQTAGNNGSKVKLWDCNGRTIQQWYATGAGGTEIANAYDNKCLDGNLPTAGHNGSKVQLWTCNEGDIQIWYFYSVSP